MSAVNEFRKLNVSSIAILEPMIRLLAPFAPFIAEELWSHLDRSESVHLAAFPQYDEQHLKEDTIAYPICINGKKRTEHAFASDAAADTIEEVVLGLDSVQKWIEGKQVRKVIVVPNRMINIVV